MRKGRTFIFPYTKCGSDFLSFKLFHERNANNRVIDRRGHNGAVTCEIMFVRIQYKGCRVYWGTPHADYVHHSVQLRHQYNYTSECKSSQINNECLHLYNIIQTSIFVVCCSWLYVNEDIQLVLDPNNNCCPIALPSLPNSLSNKARLYTCCKDIIQWLPFHNTPAYLNSL